MWFECETRRREEKTELDSTRCCCCTEYEKLSTEHTLLSASESREVDDGKKCEHTLLHRAITLSFRYVFGGLVLGGRGWVRGVE